MPDSITFIIPQLFNEEVVAVADQSTKKSIIKFLHLLRRSKYLKNEKFELWLLKTLGIESEVFNCAHLMAFGDGIAKEQLHREQWLRADPVMLTATHNGIYCRGNRILNLTNDERNSIALVLNEYFKGDGLEFYFPSEHRGYIKVSDRVATQFTPLTKVMGQEITPLLPRGSDDHFWHRTLTDIQMLFHTCEVNQQRQSRGEQTINGLWFWAEDRHNPQQSLKVSNLFTDNPAVSAIYQSEQNLNQLASEFSLDSITTGENYIHISEFSECYQQLDYRGWNKLCHQWIDSWFIPAIGAVKNGKLQTVTFYLGEDTILQMDSSARWAFWRNHQFKSIKNNLNAIPSN